MNRVIGTSNTLMGASESILRFDAAPLNFRYEAARYISWMMVNRTDSQRELLHKFARQLRFQRGTRVITAIPVHAGEQQPLSTLLALKRQKYTIGHQTVLFLNTGPGDSPNTLSAAVSKAEADCLKNVTVLAHRFTKKTNIGEIRGLLFDAIVIAALQCELEDPVVISTDADVLGFAPGYLRKVRSFFDRNRYLDFMTGDIYWGLEHRKLNGSTPKQTQLPELFLTGEYWVSRLRANADPGGLILFPGANTSMRLASYCAVGGLDYSRLYSEDHQIGARLQTLRRTFHSETETPRQFFSFCPKVFVIVNPRRSLLYILRNYFLDAHQLDVTRIKGAGIALSQMEKKYLEAKNVIQAQHITRALQGDSKSLGFVRDRISFLIDQLVLNDHALKSEKVLREVLSDMGFHFKNSRSAKLEIRKQDLPRIFHLVKHPSHQYT